MSPLAHGGGVPEAAMIVLPLLLLGAFLVLERRARRREAASDAGPDESGQNETSQPTS